VLVASSRGQSRPGVDFMILKYFRRKNPRKNWRFLFKKAKLCKNLIMTLVFEKNANLFAENCQNRSKL
jgi:hypothetical protein